MRPLDLFSRVCGDQNRYFRAQWDLFLNLTNTDFIPQLNQSIRRVLPQDKIEKMNLNKT